MRVHYHVPAAFVGGAERQLQYLIKYLRRLDPAIYFSITYECPEIAVFLSKLDVPFTCRVADRKALILAVNICAPDVLQFYTSQLMYRALPYLAKKPRVIEVIHNKNQFPGDATSYGKEHTSVAICVSPDAELFINGHCPSLKTEVIPNGVDHDQFHPVDGTRSPTPVIGFAGRLCKDKGIDTLIELLPQLPCPLELVGQDFGDYHRFAERGKLTVFPHTDHPQIYYRKWWAFISASPHESFGLAIAEAMACDTPPVMLDCGGITDYLEHSHNAMIADDEEDLLSLTRRIIEKRAFILPASVDFSAETMAKRYLDIYNRKEVTWTVPVVTKVTGTPAPIDMPKIFKPVKDRPKVACGVLGVTPPGWYGVVRALAGCCDLYATPENAVHVIKKERPGLVVLGCFQKGWLPICVAAHSVGAKVVGTWHASYILNEFDNINREWMAELLDAYKARQIDYLATPHQGLAHSWQHFGYPTAYFPNFIDEDLPKVAKLPGLNIGILGSGQSWKNMECQIVAAAMVPGNPTIHVQEVRNPAVLNRLGIKVKVHPKTLTDAEYYALLGGMTVNMCVSLSEVYSYLTAESFLLGVPVLASSITPLVRYAYDDGSGNNSACMAFRDCSHQYFEDPVSMVGALENLIRHAEDLGPRLKQHVLLANADAYRICQETLESWT